MSPPTLNNLYQQDEKANPQNLSKPVFILIGRYFSSVFSSTACQNQKYTGIWVILCLFTCDLSSQTDNRGDRTDCSDTRDGIITACLQKLSHKNSRLTEGGDSLEMTSRSETAPRPAFCGRNRENQPCTENNSSLGLIQSDLHLNFNQRSSSAAPDESRFIINSGQIRSVCYASSLLRTQRRPY